MTFLTANAVDEGIFPLYVVLLDGEWKKKEKRKKSTAICLEE